MFPPILRPIVGKLVRAWRVRWYHRRLLQILVPSIAKMSQDSQSDETSTRHQNSFASWWIQEATDGLSDSKALDPTVLATIIIQLNFAGLHTTSLTTANALYHILSYKNSTDLMNELRSEIGQSATDAEGHWTWACIEKMTLLDSVVRESLRCAPIDAVAINRTIVEDIETPDGLHISAGTRVCVPGYLANVDESRYDYASTFDPYRFVKGNGVASTEKSWTVNENYTTFGYGLHVSSITMVGKQCHASVSCS